MQNNKGFTLIELLVVIAIIGILAGIIVVSMGGAQNSANAAKIQSTLNQMRTTAQMYALSNTTNVGNYSSSSSSVLATTTDCTASSPASATSLFNTMGASTSFQSLCLSLVSPTDYNPIVTVEAGGTTWCTQVALPTTGSWCVDSTGYSGSAHVECSATVALCDAP